jgi:hypothetical protein
MNDKQIDAIARKYAGMGGIEDYRAFAKEIAAATPVDAIQLARTMLESGYQSGHMVSEAAAQDMLKQFNDAVRETAAPEGEKA